MFTMNVDLKDLQARLTLARTPCPACAGSGIQAALPSHAEGETTRQKSGRAAQAQAGEKPDFPADEKSGETSLVAPAEGGEKAALVQARKHSTKWCDIDEDEVSQLVAAGWEIRRLFTHTATEEIDRVLTDARKWVEANTALLAELEAVKAERDEFRSCLATASGKLMVAEARADKVIKENNHG